MPALNPPGMQIGALPPGYGPLPPTGPALQYGQNVATPRLVQQVAGASSAAAPATFTLGGIAATQPGTTLVCLVSMATSAAPTITTPTGFTQPGGTSGAATGLACRGYVQTNNPGGITSVVFTTLTNVNGIAVWFGEFANAFVIDPNYFAFAGGQGASGVGASGTVPSCLAYPPLIGPVVVVGAEFDVTGQAFTPGLLGASWVTGTTATSTLGATNTIIRPFYAFTDPVLGQTYQVTGSLAGSIANGAMMISLLAATTGPLLQGQPQSYPAAPSGVAAAWGALGGTKPGGAGGGQ